MLIPLRLLGPYSDVRALSEGLNLCGPRSLVTPVQVAGRGGDVNIRSVTIAWRRELCV